MVSAVEDVARALQAAGGALHSFNYIELELEKLRTARTDALARLSQANVVLKREGHAEIDPPTLSVDL